MIIWREFSNSGRMAESTSLKNRLRDRTNLVGSTSAQDNLPRKRGSPNRGAFVPQAKAKKESVSGTWSSFASFFKSALSIIDDGSSHRKIQAQFISKTARRAIAAGNGPDLTPNKDGHLVEKMSLVEMSSSSHLAKPEKASLPQPQQSPLLSPNTSRQYRRRQLRKHYDLSPMTPKSRRRRLDCL